MQLCVSLLVTLFAPALLSQAAVLDLRRDGHLPRDVAPPSCSGNCEEVGGFKVCELSRECTVTGDGVRYRKCGHTDCTAPGQHAIDTKIQALCATFGEDIEGNPAWIKQDDGNFLTAKYVNEECMSGLPNCAFRVLPESNCGPVVNPPGSSSSGLPHPIPTPSLSSVPPSATPTAPSDDPNAQPVDNNPDDEEDEECEDDEELVEV